MTIAKQRQRNLSMLLLKLNLEKKVNLIQKDKNVSHLTKQKKGEVNAFMLRNKKGSMQKDVNQE